MIENAVRDQIIVEEMAKVLPPEEIATLALIALAIMMGNGDKEAQQKIAALRFALAKRDVDISEL